MTGSYRCACWSECEAACSLAVVVRLCHGRQNCSVTADVDTFGTPCRPGTTEYLRVVYACGKSASGVLNGPTLPVPRSLRLLHLSLQCFDAVGWAAGRASGL